ncbi:MAG: small multi-drug export protein [Oscillospiraceae bacterium]|nr:small multi-drug export protein [Oscillospiraceae bacterium]MDD6526773.1 small multi-drug export protein [Oscillospiraceae bacterium]
MESIAHSIVAALDGKIAPELIAFIVSLLPVLELRGGLIAAKLMDIEFWKAFVICYVGNMLPIPFILLFIRRIFNFLKRFQKFEKIIDKLEARSLRKADKVKKYRLWGLFLFVAIPLPGTGAWTGALVADIFDIRIKHSLPIIAVGVLTAGIIMSALSYGLFGALGF